MKRMSNDVFISKYSQTVTKPVPYTKPEHYQVNYFMAATWKGGNATGQKTVYIHLHNFII